ncbi:MAG: hypothetical protein GY866_05415 [Proteobacteria bacterium]|nr:hypothetical protein [Pseudomonadota bacterium]
MKTRKPFYLITMLVMVLGLLSLNACSRHRIGHGNPERLLEHIDDHVEDLDLNDEQNVKYQEIRAKAEVKLTNQHLSRKKFMLKLKDRINQKNPDISALNGQLKEKLKAMPPALSAYLDYFEEFYNILNDEQKAEVLEEFRDKINRRF